MDNKTDKVNEEEGVNIEKTIDNYIQETKFQVIDNMKAYGGSFVFTLAELIQRSDNRNLRKIYETWTKEWKKYYEFTRR